MRLRSRLKWALCGYAVLGVAAWLTLDGAMRWLVLVILGALGVMSYSAVRRQELE